MLVNLTPDTIEIERRKKISLENNLDYIPQSDEKWLQEEGIYQCSCNFNFSFNEFLEFQNMPTPPMAQSFELFAPDYIKSNYGVADNIAQIKEYYKEEIGSKDKKYVINLTPVFQDKSKKGQMGWRWCKWGPYIGELNPKAEYLDDEDFGPDFKYVICFHITEVVYK